MGTPGWVITTTEVRGMTIQYLSSGRTWSGYAVDALFPGVVTLLCSDLVCRFARPGDIVLDMESKENFRVLAKLIRVALRVGEKPQGQVLVLSQT